MVIDCCGVVVAAGYGASLPGYGAAQAVAAASRLTAAAAVSRAGRGTAPTMGGSTSTHRVPTGNVVGITPTGKIVDSCTETNQLKLA